MAAEVLQVVESDTPGNVRLLLSERIGTTQAGDTVTARTGEIEQTFVLTGQREFDVLAGATVTFPDGGTWTEKKGK